MRWREMLARVAAGGSKAALLMTAAVLMGEPADVRAATPTHPLDPLSAEEMAIVRNVVTSSRRFSRETEVAWIQLHEPPKRLVEAFHPEDPFPRKADVAAIDYAAGKSFAVVVDVKAARIDGMTELTRSQPGLTARDIERARKIVSEDPRVRQALVRHGVDVGDGMEAVRALYMATGTDPEVEGLRGRLVRVMFAADQDATNNYGPVLDGVMVLVDVYAGRVVSLYDRPSAPVLKVPHDVFDAGIRGQGGAKAVPPVAASGRSFKVDGNVIEWASWRLRFSFNGREGLVLYQITFADHGRQRPVVYRASVSEILSRYGDASMVWPWMEFFDESNLGLGMLSVPVVPGREVPANAATLTPVPASGDPSSTDSSESRIFAYERDAGNLLYYRQDDLMVHRRATELVVGFLVPLGNYAYTLRWVFKQDGSFAFEAELAGEILTKLVQMRTCDGCAEVVRRGRARAAAGRGRDGVSGTLVSPNVVGVNHQHWFNLRLDFDVDGLANAVVENNVRRLAPRAGRGTTGVGPYFERVRTLLTRAADARRDVDDDTSRTWTIVNPSSRGPTGAPVGYEVVPNGNASTVYPRSREMGPAGFTFHHLWVTPYRNGELFADGRFPNQATPRDLDSLYHYANHETIYDRDIVIWYSLGETHVPRVEDYPLMSDTTVSVLFRPDGFFRRNPAFGGDPLP